MRYLTLNIEKKTVTIGGVPKQVINGTFKDISGNEVEASIWKVNKDGDFPNFDTLAAGQEFEGNAWTSPAGKTSIYPPKPQGGGKSSPTGGVKAGIAQAMEKKETSIGKSMDRKEESIKESSTARDATLLLTTFFDDLSNVPEVQRLQAIELKWSEIRKMLWKRFEYKETSKGYNGEEPIDVSNSPF